MPPTLRFSTPADRDAILAFIQRMGFNPRDAVTWDGLNMVAMTAWMDEKLIAAIPVEPRILRISADKSVRAFHETVVAVDAQYRGGGLGSLLQQELANKSTDTGLLTVFREDPTSPAYRWYIKNGFFPVMQVTSWFYDRPADLAAGIKATSWNINDATLPWPQLEDAWATRYQSLAGGVVHRTSRSLRNWLAIHPYRHRYEFHIVADPSGGYALLGVGQMHSETIRADILEFMPGTPEPGSAEILIRAIATIATREKWHPIRLPLAINDPAAIVLQSMHFQPGWTFDMLARPINSTKLPETYHWRYAGIDYI